MSDKKKILVVDDEPAILETAKALLLRKGYDVDTAENGDRVMQLIRASLPDLVLTDISMPGVDGIELIRSIHKEFPDLPIIAMSGNAVGRKFLEAARIFGAVATLQKPYEAPELLQIVENMLNRNRS